MQTHYAALSTSALRLSELPEAIDPRDIDSLRYVLNFADTNTRVSSVMKTFTLPDRVTTKDRLERLYATLTKGARDAG